VNWQNRIVIDPNIIVGKPIIRGTRLTVEFILNLMDRGWNTEDIMKNYFITIEDIVACIIYDNEAPTEHFDIIEGTALSSIMKYSST
jgi:uncharacterized protein (DUF433 family)